MTWNPSVRQTPILVTARPGPKINDVKLKEMQGAAAAVVAMVLARKKKMRPIPRGIISREASAWTVQGRIQTANRWRM